MQNLYFDWKTSNALHKIESMNNIHTLRIATAFIEQQGINWIKNIIVKHGLSKDHVEVYISIDFSFNQPSVLLEQLTVVADTYIVTKQKLHAKVILALDKVGVGKIMHGSANLTNMGIYHNLELSTVLDVTAPTHSNILMFFERLGDLATYAEPMVIEGYRNREELISNSTYAHDSGDTIFKPVFKSEGSNQLPSEDDLADFYFQYEDYETLLEENAPLVTQELHQHRKVIRNKLLVLHDKIEAFANKLGLHSHWDDKHKVSQIEPSHFNFGRVNWMAVRFGKHKTQLEGLLPERSYREKEQYSFPKHGCIQLSLGQHGLSIGLFHAVRNNAWDRAYVFDKIEKDPKFTNTIAKHLEKLEGYGYTWYIHDPVSGQGEEFDIDEQQLRDFPHFYSMDEAGFESFLTTTYEHDNDEIKTVEDISNTIKYHMKLLKPLYDLMVQVP